MAPGLIFSRLSVSQDFQPPVFHTYKNARPSESNALKYFRITQEFATSHTSHLLHYWRWDAKFCTFVNTKMQNSDIQLTLWSRCKIQKNLWRLRDKVCNTVNTVPSRVKLRGEVGTTTHLCWNSLGVPSPEGRKCTDPVSADAILGKGGGDSPDRIKGRQLAPNTGGDKTWV